MILSSLRAEIMLYNFTMIYEVPYRQWKISVKRVWLVLIRPHKERKSRPEELVRESNKGEM